MTTQEIDEYIIAKIIPLSFIWENDVEYNLYCLTNGYQYLFPNHNNWVKVSYSSLYQLTFINRENESLYYKHQYTFEKCISEFIYWFEINKHRCKSINFYIE